MVEVWNYNTIQKYERILKEMFEEIEKRVDLNDFRTIEFQKFWEATPETFPKCLPYWECFIIMKNMKVFKFTVKPMKRS